MAIEDPMHYGWHRVKTWNDDTFRRHKLKSMVEFEKRLPKDEKEKTKWTSLGI
jgi:hypothetical protein